VTIGFSLALCASCNKQGLDETEQADVVTTDSGIKPSAIEPVTEADVDELLAANTDAVLDWRVDFDIGAALLAQEEYEGAKTHLRRAARLAEAPEDVAAAQFSLGAALIEEGQIAPGVESIQSAIHGQPGLYVKGLYWLGRARLQEGNANAAAALLSEYRLQRPLDTEAAFWLGRASYEQGATEAASALFAEAVTDFPHVAEFHHWLGMAALRRLDYDRASASLRRAIELGPANADSHYELAKLSLIRDDVGRAAISAGDLWLLAGDVERAGQLLEDLYRATPSNLEVRRQLGRLRLAEAEFVEAGKLLKSVTEDPSTSATDHAYLGWTLLAASDLPAAEAAFNAALAVNSEHAFAKEGLGWLRLKQGQPPSFSWDDLAELASSPLRLKAARFWTRRVANQEENAFAPGKFTGLGVAGLWNDGLRVLVVVEGSPAKEAGIVPGDCITEIDGVQIDGERDWDSILADTPTGGVAFVGWTSADEQRFAVARMETQQEATVQTARAGDS